MAFSFELKLAISSELYGAISAGPEQRFEQNVKVNWFLSDYCMYYFHLEYKKGRANESFTRLFINASFMKKRD